MEVKELCIHCTQGKSKIRTENLGAVMSNKVSQLSTVDNPEYFSTCTGCGYVSLVDKDGEHHETSRKGQNGMELARIAYGLYARGGQAPVKMGESEGEKKPIPKNWKQKGIEKREKEEIRERVHEESVKQEKPPLTLWQRFKKFILQLFN